MLTKNSIKHHIDKIVKTQSRQNIGFLVGKCIMDLNLLGDVHSSDWLLMILDNKNGFQQFSKSLFIHDYLHQLWKHIHYISIKID